MKMYKNNESLIWSPGCREELGNMIRSYWALVNRGGGAIGNQTNDYLCF